MELRKDAEVGPSPTRSDGASRSLLQKPPAESLSSGFQVLPYGSRQEDGGKLSCSRLLEEEGVGPWQEEEARPSQEADSSTPSCHTGCTICAFEGGRRGKAELPWAQTPVVRISAFVGLKH